MNLYDADTDALVGTDETDADGRYLFSGLEPGDYYVIFELSATDEFVEPNVGGDPGLDSDADTILGRTPVITVLADVIDKSWDAGIVYVDVGGIQITTTTPETLPFTGADLGEGGAAGIALALLALGGVALLAVRRREDVEIVAAGWSDRLWDVQ